MSYDPRARRQTPLAVKLRQRIAAGGPLGIADYMDACLGDPEHGYYRVRHAIGGAGDFVTAPEISQVFGELIGLWAAVVWQQMGSPGRFDLVEIGPGRGTMMADALRAARRVPRFLEAAHIVLVEPSPVLREAQRQRLAGQAAPPAAIAWLEGLEELAVGPAIVLANEVLDVLPVTQLVHEHGAWRRRVITIDASGALQLGADETDVAEAAPSLAPAPAAGDVFERRDFARLLGALVGQRGAAPLAGLFIDYGHEGPALGDTLQAVRGHAYEHPLTSPGEADLTAQVDFAAFAVAARRFGLAVDGPVPQAGFLGALGIAERGSRLMAANPREAGRIEADIARLMAPLGMGGRFKAIGLRSPDLPALPGLAAVDKEGRST